MLLSVQSILRALMGSILAQLIFLASCNTRPAANSVLATATPASVLAAASPARLASSYGVNYPWWARMADASSQEMVARAADAGFGWIRLYLPWGLIERAQGTFDWG